MAWGQKESGELRRAQAGKGTFVQTGHSNKAQLPLPHLQKKDWSPLPCRGHKAVDEAM